MHIGSCAIGSANNWWLRSANSAANFRNVNNNGNANNNNANNSNGVVLGFFSDRQSNPARRNQNREEEKECMTLPSRVNTGLDGNGRTLLAWRGLVVIPRFIPIVPMPLHATTKQGCEAIFDWRDLTSEERREARYERRKAAREARKLESIAELDSYGKVFTYQHVYDAYRKSRRNVAWKTSVQRYICQAPYNVYQTYQTITERKYEPKGFFEFDLVERGKMRHIRSVGIRERVVQRCLCDHCLVPALSRTFVYDNGASLQGKGYTFSQDRMTEHLRRHYRKYGTEGYILLFDLTKFFDSIPHDKAKEAIARQMSDPDILKVAYDLIDAYPGEYGLGLGSQISQIVALAVLSPLDHHIKDHFGVKLYGRYMDDGYIIHEDKNYLRQMLAAIRRKCAEIGVTLNERKTQIAKLSHGFTWLKVRYWFTETGRVIRKPAKSSATRMRKRLRAFRRKVDEGRMTEWDAWQSLQSWRSYVMHFNAYRTIRETERLCTELFGSEPRKGAIYG